MIWKNTTVSIRIVTLSFVITGCGSKSTTCSFKFTRFATRPAAVRWLNKGRVKTNAESLVGAAAVVTESIDNLAGKGRVQVKGQSWSACAVADDIQIETGKQVKIKKISGVKLIVEEV